MKREVAPASLPSHLLPCSPAHCGDSAVAAPSVAVVPSETGGRPFLGKVGLEERHRSVPPSAACPTTLGKLAVEALAALFKPLGPRGNLSRDTGDCPRTFPESQSSNREAASASTAQKRSRSWSIATGRELRSLTWLYKGDHLLDRPPAHQPSRRQAALPRDGAGRGRRRRRHRIQTIGDEPLQ